MHRIISLLGILLFSAIFFVTPKMAFAAGETEDNNTIAKANPISIGLNNALSANLSNGDLDYFKFSAQANRTYVIETYNIQGGRGSEATGLWLYNSSGTLLDDDNYGNNGSGDANARIIFTPIASETFIVLVKKSDWAGSWAGAYHLRVLPDQGDPAATWDKNNQYEPNDTFTSANKIEVGLKYAVTRTLFDNRSISSDRPDYDYYYFSAKSGRTYIIETFNIQGSLNSEATGLWLYNSSGTQLGDDNYGNNGSSDANARIIFTANSDDNYFVLVKQSDWAAHWFGSYSFRIMPKYDEPGNGAGAEDEPNNVIPLATKIDIGLSKAVTRTLFNNSSLASNASDQDYYRFTATAGRSYVIETFNIQGEPGQEATGLWLYNSSGTYLADDNYGNNGSGNSNARLSFTANATDTYYIRVAKSDWANSWYGTYSLRVLPKFDEAGAARDGQGEPNDSSYLATPINVGAQHVLSRTLFDHSNYVTNGSDVDYYAFKAERNTKYMIQTLRVQKLDKNYATGIWIYNSEGTYISDDDTGKYTSGNINAEVIFTTTTAGTYLIKVAKSRWVNSWTGSYSIRVCANDCRVTYKIYLPRVRR
jgi:hypothetical protein